MPVFILKDFRSLSKKKFAILLTNLTNGLYFYILVFLLPPETKVDFDIAVTAYTKASKEYDAGGKGFKVAFVTARDKMLAILDKLHNYVTVLPGLDLIIATQSGFNLNPAAVVVALVQATLRKMTRLGGNAIRVEYNIVPGATYYVMILVEDGVLPAGVSFANGIWSIPKGLNPRIIVNNTKPRIKTFNDLVSDMKYSLLCFSGNASSVSVMSDATNFTFSNV